MNMKEIIGLRRRPQLIAAGIYIVSLVSLFLPFASVGGKTVSGVSAALSLGGLHLAAAVLTVLAAAIGAFLLVRPSVKGARLWAAAGAVETAAVSIVLFASIRERLEFSDPPKAFRGFPIALITAGLMALCFMGFSGLQIPW